MAARLRGAGRYDGFLQLSTLLSRPVPIEAGVVQGSRLGPTLFSLFINNLIQAVKSSTSGATLLNGGSCAIALLCGRHPISFAYLVKESANQGSRSSREIQFPNFVTQSV